MKEELIGKPKELSGLIGFQEGSVVSREVIRKDAGTVTLFAFDQGQGLSEHTAPYDALVYVIEGEADVSVAGKPNAVREGELIIMPAGKPHALNAKKKFKMMLVMIRK